MTEGGGVDLEAAQRFVLANTRLLDRHRLVYLLHGGAQRTGYRRAPRLSGNRMRDLHWALPIGLAVIALAAVGCGDRNHERSATTAETVATDATTTETSTTGLPKLIGTVGSSDDPDAYEINLATEDGAEVTATLLPGKYMLEINDLSTIHNFHLGGPRAAVDVATDVAGTGERTVIVLLNEPEAYIYVCDVHPTTMKVTFSIHGRIRDARLNAQSQLP